MAVANHPAGRNGVGMARKVVKVLPLVIVAIGACTLVLGLGFLVLGHGLLPAGGVHVLSVDSYSFVTSDSSRLTHLANWAGLALLVVGTALLMLAWLAAYWRRVARFRTA